MVTPAAALPSTPLFSRRLSIQSSSTLAGTSDRSAGCCPRADKKLLASCDPAGLSDWHETGPPEAAGVTKFAVVVVYA